MYVCANCSYEEALQALADSEAKRETSDKELKLVSQSVRVHSLCTYIAHAVLT